MTSVFLKIWYLLPVINDDSLKKLKITLAKDKYCYSVLFIVKLWCLVKVKKNQLTQASPMCYAKKKKYTCR